ncbi:GNAT family N-acetyltransferase [Candidatus Hydrogenedentota bacterium]
MGYRTLDWDTKLLGEKVAEISVASLSTQELGEILPEMQRNGIRLAYWLSSREMPEAEVKQLCGLLVDRKTTFISNLDHIGHGSPTPPGTVKPFDSSMSMADLERLALQSGEYSRFRVDPDFPEDKFVELYTTWIRKSVRKELADEVLTVQGVGEVVGFITLNAENSSGEIGLIAVDETCRGRGYGEVLVKAAQDWFVAHGLKSAQVVTQGDNVPACKLYSKCGYSIEKIEYHYHFWL